LAKATLCQVLLLGEQGRY